MVVEMLFVKERINMTTYYLLLEGDTEEDSFYETNVLGEESLGTFYAGQGFIAFNNIVNKQPQLLESVTILTDKKQQLTITQFLDALKGLRIKKA